jgi:hypothetical protein
MIVVLNGVISLSKIHLFPFESESRAAISIGRGSYVISLLTKIVDTGTKSVSDGKQIVAVNANGPRVN